MSAFGGLILTNKGRALQAKAQAGTQLNFTRIGVGEGQLGSSSIVDLNALKNEIKSLDIVKLKTLTDGKAVVGGILSNQDIVTGFYWREIGVFAQDPDVGEVLYCYGNAGANAEYIPAGGGADILDKYVDIVTIVGNVANVTATIDESLIYATQQDITLLQQQIENITVPVTSVNNKTGAVVLSAADVGAETLVGAQIKADAAEISANDYTDLAFNDLAGEGRTAETVRGNSTLIGTLTSLLTTAKDNLVNAINEIYNWLSNLQDNHDAHLAEHYYLQEEEPTNVNSTTLWFAIGNEANFNEGGVSVKNAEISSTPPETNNLWFEPI